MTVLHRGLEQEVVVHAVLQVISKSFDFESTFKTHNEHWFSFLSLDVLRA